VVVRFGHGDGLGRDGLLGEKSDLAAHLFHARFRKEQSAGSLRGLPAPAVDPSRHARTRADIHAKKGIRTDALMRHQ
jgi:hypothetical protein